MRKHNFLQNIVNSLRNDFDKVLESFQGIRAHDDFTATLAAPSEVRTCATGDLTERFNNYWKARRRQSESGWINERLEKVQERHLNGNYNKRQGCNPKLGSLGLRNDGERQPHHYLPCRHQYTRKAFPPCTSLASRLLYGQNKNVSSLIFAFAAFASRLPNFRVHCSLPARPQTPVANTVSAAQRSIKRFGGCTLQIIVYLLPHLRDSVSARNVEGSLWTWSSWPSLGAKISLPLRPVRDPFEAVYATCLKKQWLE